MKIGQKNLASEVDRVDLDLPHLELFWFCSVSILHLLVCGVLVS